MDFIEERDIVIRASSQADFEARVQEHHENMARQKGFEPGYLAIDFAMPKSEFDAKG
jgi:glutamyl-tRNA reductase